MLSVRFRRDGRNRPSSIVAEGHADYADAGQDIVCAAASAVLQSVWIGLQEHANIAVHAERGAGRLMLRWPPETRDREDVRAIVATAELSLAHMARQFPEHVRVQGVSDN